MQGTTIQNFTKVSNYGITSHLHLSSSHTHHVASIYGIPLKATKVNCCVAQAVRICERDNLAIWSADVSGRNVHDNDTRRKQRVSFIVSLDMAAAAGCPGAYFLHDKALELGAEMKWRPS